MVDYCASSSDISVYDYANFSVFFKNNISFIDGEKSLMWKIRKLCRCLPWIVKNQSMSVLVFSID